MSSVENTQHANWRKNNPAKYKAWYTRNNARNNTKIRNRKWQQANPAKALIIAARYRAKQRGVICDLVPEDIVIPASCPILNVPLIKKTQYAPSVDRISPDKGYTKTNIQVISRKANAMKSNATVSELRRFADWILKEYGTANDRRDFENIS